MSSQPFPEANLVSQGPAETYSALEGTEVVKATFRGSFDGAVDALEGLLKGVPAETFHRRIGSNLWAAELGGGTHTLRIGYVGGLPPRFEWKLIGRRHWGDHHCELQMGFSKEALAAWCKHFCLAEATEGATTYPGIIDDAAAAVHSWLNATLVGSLYARTSSREWALKFGGGSYTLRVGYACGRFPDATEWKLICRRHWGDQHCEVQLGFNKEALAAWCSNFCFTEPFESAATFRGTVDDAAATVEGWLSGMLAESLRKRIGPDDWALHLGGGIHNLRVGASCGHPDSLEWKLICRRNCGDHNSEVQLNFSEETLASWCKHLCVAETFEGDTTYRGTFDDAAATVEGWLSDMLAEDLHTRVGLYDWALQLGGGRHNLHVEYARGYPDAFEWMLTGRRNCGDNNCEVQVGFSQEALAAYCIYLAGPSNKEAVTVHFHA